MILGETEMENTRISTTILMVLASIEIGVAEIVTKPTGTEVVVGSSTLLNCSTNSRQEIHWFHTPFGSNLGRDLVYGYDTFYKQYLGRFQMEKNEATGAYNLVIPSVKIEDAGLYECQDETGGGSKASAQLIVLDANPVCEPHLDIHEIIGPNKCGIEPNQLILSCAVTYHGNEAPIMAWWRASDNAPASEGVTQQIIDNNQVVYNLTIKGNSAVKDGDSYFCNTTRSATLDGGCNSGKVKVKGTGVDSSSEICEPYVKPYIAALICFFLIILPTAVGGSIFATWWYLSVYIPKKPMTEVGAAEEMDVLQGSTRSRDSDAERGQEELNTLNHHQRSEGECSNGRDVKPEKLESQLAKLLERIGRRDETIKEHTRKDLSTNEKINSLQLEIDQLQDKLKDLEDRLYPKENIDYFDKPVLAHMIELSENGKDIPEKHNELSEKNEGKSEKNKGKSEKHKMKAINGIAVLDKELFVAAKFSQEIAVYDSKTFQHARNMKIRGMTNPLDIASSKNVNCLYIVDQSIDQHESTIVRFEPTGKVLHQWPTSGRKGRMSTYGSSVILCLSDKHLINEYSPEGKLIVKVRLSPAAKLNNPLHAIKVTSTHFVVSHGDFSDELHRVCVVNLNGEIIKECTRREESSIGSHANMKVPLCLLEDNEGSVIVADTDRKRLLVLSSMLKYQRKLIEEDNGLKDFPVRLCFDDTRSRLFVAVNKWSDSKKDWKDGRIQIFNIK